MFYHRWIICGFFYSHPRDNKTSSRKGNPNPIPARILHLRLPRLLHLRLPFSSSLPPHLRTAQLRADNRTAVPGRSRGWRRGGLGLSSGSLGGGGLARGADGDGGLACGSDGGEDNRGPDSGGHGARLDGGEEPRPHLLWLVLSCRSSSACTSPHLRRLPRAGGGGVLGRELVHGPSPPPFCVLLGASQSVRMYSQSLHHPQRKDNSWKNGHTSIWIQFGGISHHQSTWSSLRVVVVDFLDKPSYLSGRPRVQRGAGGRRLLPGGGSGWSTATSADGRRWLPSDQHQAYWFWFR